jgi:hypothetical protein
MRAAVPADDPGDPQEAPLQRIESSRQDPVSTTGGSSRDDKDAEVALDVMRGLADQELARAERASTRARQAFALAAGFFAIVQTVAFGSFEVDLVSNAERETLLDKATLAAIFLAVCGALLLVADSAFRSRDLDEDVVEQKLAEAGATKSSAARIFVETYGVVLYARRRTNRIRFLFVTLTQLAAIASIVFVLLELRYGLDARVK